MEIYVDGFRVASRTAGVPTSTHPTTDPLLIGNGYSGSPNPFPGSIDEVAIYDYPLSSEQVLEHFTQGGGILPEPPPPSGRPPLPHR